jgi:GWxTD domain-containing protein
MRPGHYHHHPFRTCIVFSLLLVAVGTLTSPLAFAGAEDKLSPHYREWLDRDVAYIITRAERTAFLQLTTDDARNQFIDEFWEVRNPTPGAPINPYKAEHYQRLEYASDHFSNNKTRDGWKTDMGRIYITLGPPEQKGRYVTQSEVRGMEIWFYSSSHPALPPFFNIVFYEKDFGDFRLYSPRMDGPQKLVTSHHMENGAVESVQVIDRMLGREVALTTLSLIPGEPVNINDAETSLQSDVMLNTIKNLANHPFTVDALNLRRSLNESVTHRVVMSGELLNVLTVPLRDPQGDIRLQYAMRLSHPADFAIAESADRYYYSIEISVKVSTPEKKLIFSQERKLSRYVDKDEMQLMKSRPFGYESWLPLAPGKYKLELTLTNLLNKTAFTAERDVVVPSPPQDAFALTDVVAFSQAKQVDPTQAAVLPFTSGGVNFTPYVGPELNLLPGEDLKIFYQIWLPPTPSEKLAGKKLLVDYAYGRPSLQGSAKTIHDEVSKDQFDLGGAMINGKKIPTVDLPVGNYRMVVTVTDPESQQKRFASLSFHIVSDQASPLDAWDAYDDLADYVKTGQAEYERGLTYLLAGDQTQAAQWFAKAVKRNPNNDLARARLADFYFSQREFSKVVELYSQMIVTAQTEEETILNVADSFDKIGNTKKAATVVESALTVKPTSGPLYLALSSYYQRLGDAQKAGELERKGRSLMTTANP